MKKVIRLTESDLIKLVKKVINENRGMGNAERINTLFKCTGLETEGAGWTAQVMAIEMNYPALSNLTSATDDLNFGLTSNWNDDSVLKFLSDCSRDRTLMNKLMSILSCYMKKMNIPMVENNPILTLARKTFTTNLGVGSIPDIGGRNQYEKAKSILSQMGMKL